MSGKISVLIVCQATSVQKVTSMVTNCAQPDITVHTKQVLQMHAHVLQGHTQKRKEHRVRIKGNLWQMERREQSEYVESFYLLMIK